MVPYESKATRTIWASLIRWLSSLAVSWQVSIEQVPSSASRPADLVAAAPGKPPASHFWWSLADCLSQEFFSHAGLSSSSMLFCQVPFLCSCLCCGICRAASEKSFLDVRLSDLCYIYSWIRGTLLFFWKGSDKIRTVSLALWKPEELTFFVQTVSLKIQTCRMSRVVPISPGCLIPQGIGSLCQKMAVHSQIHNVANSAQQCPLWAWQFLVSWTSCLNWAVGKDPWSTSERWLFLSTRPGQAWTLSTAQKVCWPVRLVCSL